MKPCVVLYKSLPDDLRKRLDVHCDVTEISGLTPDNIARHAETVRQAEGLLGSGGKVDADFL
ncbi:bifunctional glyoxylate/hydroxypyruvate reductase B, partial [Erwinia amylovora]|nr:bifunctional glyoxylate/hydroxypyruvate reductase B [Erwinia amylovora]